MKSSILLILITPMVFLFFSGCSGNGTDGVDTNSTYYKQAQQRDDIQAYLDSNDFETAIYLLENDEEYKDAYEADDLNYTLGLAYAAKAGVTLEFVENMYIDMNNSLNEAKENNRTANFFDLLFSASYDVYIDLNLKDAKKASNLLNSSDVNCSDPDRDISQIDSKEELMKDACFLAGILDIASAFKITSYLGDIPPITSTPVIDTSDELTASFCATAYAYYGNVANADCISIVEDENITFENNVTYTTLFVTMADTNNTYDYLLTAPVSGIRQTVLTDGYCTLDDFSTRIEMSHDTVSSGYYVCPVNEGSADEELSSAQLSSAQLMVNVLNGGLDAISEAVGDDPELTAQIEEFKLELIADRNSTDANTTITVEDIIHYLDSEN